MKGGTLGGREDGWEGEMKGRSDKYMANWIGGTEDNTKDKGKTKQRMKKHFVLSICT